MLDSVFIPAQETNSRRLMMVLHGLGDSEAGYRWMPQALQLDWMNYLLVNAPDPYFGGFSWYDFADDPAPSIERSRSLLFEVLDHRRGQGFPTDETTLFGFSQGCLMAWEIGFRYPHRLAGLVGVSGYMHEPEVALQVLSPAAHQQRFLITHGTVDPLIPFAQVRRQVQLVQSAGLQVEWHEFDKPHTIAGEDELAVIRHFLLNGYSPSS